jgi:arylsulfatase A-like enzyme
VILTDDQGWGDLSVHGNTNLATPHIDSLARDGALLERFFVCPVCSPTRAEFLTGRYHPRGGVRGVSTGRERLDLDERTIGQVFQQAGYATGAFGKWHNGTQSPYHPNDRGFTEYYGFCSGHWGNYFNPILDHNGQLVRGTGYLVDDLTDHALTFIEQNRDRPFFCYLPIHTPHSPMQVPDRFWQRFAGQDLALRHRDPDREDVPKTRAALAMCENIDWNVGRLLRKLDELDLRENTIVFYFSDNGPNSFRWNGGMKGRKGSTDEGGVRVPGLIRWPGRIRAGLRIGQIAAAIDLLPTLAELAGVPIATGGDEPRELDGVSLKPLLLETATDWPDRMIFSHWNRRVSVRTQQYRLDHTGGLFDMLADPDQRTDVRAQRAEVTGRLRQAVEEWRQRVLSELGTVDRPFTVGYSRVTPLPARDGVPHGNVQRSAPAPNCSFFTNWRSTDDRITWDVAVATGGTYQATVHYACAAADVGSTVELSCGDHRVRARVATAHDPPLRGAEHDRVPRRGESYVRDFRPLRLGTIQLDEGTGRLALRAVDVAGDQVMDVRYLLLTRVE